MKKLLAALLLGLASLGATAQTYPSRPIRLVVPFPAGSATDTIARVFAGAVSASMGQPVVVDNKAGADGLIAGMDVMRAPADGYTIMLGTNSPLAGAPAMKKAPPYDPGKDFTAITDIGRYTFFVVVNPAVPAKTLEELIAYAKANPDKISYATGNTTGIVATAQIAGLAGIKMLQVPYKGEPQALPDVMSGLVQMMVVSGGTSMPHIRTGKLRALAVMLPRRSKALPNVPTIVEGGVPGFSLTSWAALVGPANMPRPIVERLNKEFNAAMNKPEVMSAMEKQTFELIGSTPEKLHSWINDQYDTYRNVLKAAGVEPE